MQAGEARPVRWESVRSARCPISYRRGSVSQAGQVAQFIRYFSGQLVSAEDQFLQAGEAAQFGGNFSGQARWESPRAPVRLPSSSRSTGLVQFLQAGAQFGGNRSGQLVIAEVQYRQAGQAAQLRTVSSQSTGCPISKTTAQFLQAGEAAQFIRDFSGQLVIRRGPVLVRLVRLPSSVGIGPVSSLSARFQCRQAGQVAQFIRYFSGQLVSAEDQFLQAGEAAQFGGNRSGQLVAP